MVRAFANNPLAARGQLVRPGTAPAPRAPAVAPPPLQVSHWRDENAPSDAAHRTFDAQRFVEAGGGVSSGILHPDLIPFEQLYRRQPEEGMFSPDVRPSRPFVFELGAFTVPERMALMLFDLRPDIYRFSGVDPGDYLPIESRRFGSIMGFDITVNQKQPAQVSFQLEPAPIQWTSTQAFQDNNTVFPQANEGAFAIGRANMFGNAASPGTTTQPQRHERYGALSIPFTLVARSRQVVQVTCVIFRPVPSPIAFIEYDIAGLLVPELWYDNVTKAVQPPAIKQ